MSASAEPRVAAWRSTQLSAMLSWPPTNQSAQALPRLVSSKRSYGRCQRTPMSASAASQNHSMFWLVRCTKSRASRVTASPSLGSTA
jgi:hypothetical protein